MAPPNPSNTSTKSAPTAYPEHLVVTHPETIIDLGVEALSLTLKKVSTRGAGASSQRRSLTLSDYIVLPWLSMTAGSEKRSSLLVRHAAKSLGISVVSAHPGVRVRRSGIGDALNALQFPDGTSDKASLCPATAVTEVLIASLGMFNKRFAAVRARLQASDETDPELLSHIESLYRFTLDMYINAFDRVSARGSAIVTDSSRWNGLKRKVNGLDGHVPPTSAATVAQTTETSSAPADEPAAAAPAEEGPRGRSRASRTATAAADDLDAESETPMTHTELLTRFKGFLDARSSAEEAGRWRNMNRGMNWEEAERFLEARHRYYDRGKGTLKSRDSISRETHRKRSADWDRQWAVRSAEVPTEFYRYKRDFEKLKGQTESGLETEIPMNRDEYETWVRKLVTRESQSVDGGQLTRNAPLY